MAQDRLRMISKTAPLSRNRPNLGGGRRRNIGWRNRHPLTRPTVMLHSRCVALGRTLKVALNPTVCCRHVEAFSPRLRHSDETAAKLGEAELRRVIIRVAKQIVTKHVVEAALPRLVGIAADIDPFDEFHLLLTCVLDIDVDV